ncbi:MAG: cytochrome P460 family protein [Sphingomonas sp.]|nr:cytochrome P460 family protein [Sphingomonas sp.]
MTIESIVSPVATRRRRRPLIRSLTAPGVAFGLLLAGCTSTAPTTVADTAANPAGDLRVPHNYRDTYQYLGTWAVAADTGPGSQQLHIVYASPGAATAHRATGHFPDGTTLVKEVFGAKTGTMTTGTVSRADTLMGWFVMVKDSKNSHPGNKLWGDGWGWAWFDADKPNKTTSTDYKTDCLTCHVPAKGNDWTYVEGYPVLKK